MDNGTQQYKTNLKEMRRHKRNERACYWQIENLVERLNAAKRVLAGHLSNNTMRSNYWRRWMGKQIRMTRRHIIKIQASISDI